MEEGPKTKRECIVLCQESPTPLVPILLAVSPCVPPGRADKTGVYFSLLHERLTILSQMRCSLCRPFEVHRWSDGHPVKSGRVSSQKAWRVIPRSLREAKVPGQCVVRGSNGRRAVGEDVSPSCRRERPYSENGSAHSNILLWMLSAVFLHGSE